VAPRGLGIVCLGAWSLGLRAWVGRTLGLGLAEPWGLGWPNLRASGRAQILGRPRRRAANLLERNEAIMIRAQWKWWGRTPATASSSGFSSSLQQRPTSAHTHTPFAGRPASGVNCALSGPAGPRGLIWAAEARELASGGPSGQRRPSGAALTRPS